MTRSGRLKRYELWFLSLLFLLILVFGALVVLRSAFSIRRMGDANMLFRAGWAARMGGEELYTIISDNKLHYHYPPGFAIVFAPFADPPDGVEPCLSPPFAVSVSIWYAFNVILLFYGIHQIASIFEIGEPREHRMNRRWWSLRIVPLLVCLPCVGSSLNQGQVTPLLFAMIASGIAAIGRSQNFMAGLWIALAASAKIYPAFLIIGLIYRKNGLALVGILVGLFLGIIALPVIAYGPQQTLRSYQELNSVLIGPTFGWSDDTSRVNELLSTKGPRSQSIVSMITNAMYPDRLTRPSKSPAIARILHWSIGAAMIAVTFWSFRKLRPLPPFQNRSHEALMMSSLSLIMILICPVTHLHYLMLALPAAITLLAIDRGPNVYPSISLLLIYSVHMATVVISQMPGCELLKELAVPGYGIFALWIYTCKVGLQMYRI